MPPPGVDEISLDDADALLSSAPRASSPQAAAPDEISLADLDVELSDKSGQLKPAAPAPSAEELARAQRPASMTRSRGGQPTFVDVPAAGAAPAATPKIAPIDTSRPIINNPDGSISTERTITIEADGAHLLIPTIVGGKQLTPDQAVAAWRAGQNADVGRYNTAQEAEAAAVARSQRIGQVRHAGEPQPTAEELARASRPAQMTATRGGQPVFSDLPTPDVAINPPQPEPSEFSKGLKGALVGTNPKLAGDAAEGFGVLFDNDYLVQKGGELAKYGAAELEGFKPRVPSFVNIRTDSIGGFLSDVGSYAGYQAGAGIGTSAPSLVAGGTAALIARNPFVGIAIGAVGPSYIQNFGDVYGSAKEDKDIAARVAAGQLTPKQVAAVSAVAAVPIAMLDVIGLETVLGSAFQPAKQELIRRIVKAASVGAIGEGSTEGLQQIVSQWAQDYLGSQKPFKDKLIEVVDNFFGGMMGGGIMAGGSAATQTQPAAPAPGEELGQALQQSVDQTTINPKAVQQQVVQSMQPSRAQVTATLPPAAQQRAELDRLLRDGRPYEEIRAAEEAQQRAEADAQVQAEEEATATAQAQLVEQLGVAPDSRAIVQLPGGEPMAGVVLGVEPLESGGWSMRFRADDGELYVVEADDRAVVRPEPAGDGTREAPIKITDGRDITLAEQNVNTEPTDAQKEAGNYQKGHIQWNGLPITIENPEGSTRSGTAPDGSTWSVEMPVPYGYVKRSEGADGDHVDTFLGPDAQAQTVYVIDQIDPATDQFDEHKVMLGFPSGANALDAYGRAFTDGSAQRRIGALTEMSLDEFKTWLKSGDTKAPMRYVNPKIDEVTIDDVDESLDTSKFPLMKGTQTEGLPAGEARWRTTYDYGSLEGRVLGYVAYDGPDLVRFKADDGTVIDLPPHALFPVSPEEAQETNEREAPTDEITINQAEEQTHEDATRTTDVDRDRTRAEPPTEEPTSEPPADDSGRTEEERPAETSAEGPETGTTETAEPTAEETSAARDIALNELAAHIASNDRAQLFVKHNGFDNWLLGVEEIAVDWITDEVMKAADGGDRARLRAIDSLYSGKRGSGDRTSMQPEWWRAVYTKTKLAAEKAETPTTEEPKVEPPKQEEPKREPPTALKKEKLQDAGEDMAGKRKTIKQEIEDGATGNAEKDLKKLLERAAKATVWKIELAESATPGTRVYLDRVRAALDGFVEYAGRKAGGGRKRWSDSFSKALSDYYARGDTERNEVERLAIDYIATIEALRDATADAMTIEQARLALQQALFTEWSDDGAGGRKRSDLGASVGNLLSWKRPLDYLVRARYGLAALIKEDEVITKNKPLVRPRLDAIEREGMKDHRQGRDIRAQDLIDTFGFRGVEFGNWVNGPERQKNVNLAYDALYDLADTLGMPAKAISLGGKLGLAFGSRGTGRHAAHYEPGNVVINLTKTRGDGTVAHEWGHAFDYALRTTNGTNAIDDLKEALTTVYDAEYAVVRAESLLKGTVFVKGQKRNDALKQAENFIEGEYWKNSSWGVIKMTTYKREADKLGKQYWGNPEELWAREFEGFVYDQAEGSSPYLVTDWVGDGVTTKDAGYKGSPYPAGDERARFHGYFKHLIEHVEWSAEGPRIKPGYELIMAAQKQAVRDALNELSSRLEERQKELQDGDAAKDGLWWYKYRLEKGRGAGKQPKGYFAFDDSQNAVGYPAPLDTSDKKEFQLIKMGEGWEPSDQAVYLNKEGDNERSDRPDEIRGDGEEPLGDASTADDGASEESGRAPRRPPQRTGEGETSDSGAGDGGERSGERPGGGTEDVGATTERDRGTDLASGQDAVQPTGSNYRITDADHVGEGSIEKKFADNVAAITLLKQIESENRLATPEEQKTLVKYVGWGGMPQAFSYHYQSGWEARKKQLEELLTDDEFQAARASTTNAHYTAPAVIRAMWSTVERLGFKGGRILEPAIGVGHFFGLMPDEIAAASKFTGVELDSLTARIAKQLYQRANVQNKGYETTRFPEGFFDLIISNVPFSEADKPVDKKYNRERLNLHDYYFRKSIMLTRPGGLVAFITSKGTLDKMDTKARELFAKEADLVGAIRLPEDAFQENANTTVTTDIIFLRRKAEAITPLPAEPWTATKVTELEGDNGHTLDYRLNEYYHARPEMMLGTMIARSGRYGENLEGALISAPGVKLTDALADAIERMPQNVVVEASRVEELERMAMSIPAEGDTKDGGFADKDGKLYRREGELMVPVPEVTPKEKTRGEIIRASLRVRDAIRALLRARVNDAPAMQVSALKGKIEDAYKAFVKKHGYLNDKENIEAFAEDPDAALLLALEKYDAETGKGTPIDIDFQKPKPIEHTDSVQDALSVSLATRGRVDWQVISKLTGLSIEHTKTELKGLVFDDPAQGWVTADEYLSGNVREKLEIAKDAAKADPSFADNVKALEAAIPQDLPPSKIAARPGAPWIPGDDVAVFMAELLRANVNKLRVNFLPEVGKWIISGKDTSSRDTDAGAKRSMRELRGTTEATVTWGTKSADFVDLMDYALNGGFPTIYYPPDRDGKRVVNRKATEASNAKLLEIKERFGRWIWEDPDRAARLSRKYNDEYNAVKLREYKYPATPDQIDQHGNIRLPGMAIGMALRPHQANAVWRALHSNTYLAHEVGTGKTFTMVATAMEGKRLGLVKKPIITVMNSTIGQFKAEFLRLYPGANILAMNIAESAQQRKRQIARIALNDWDAVIVTHESFARIPMSPEAIAAAMDREIGLLEEAILAAKADKMSARVVKELEKSKKAFENKMKRLLEKREKDDVLSFEELGVDAIAADEAQTFKNLMFATKMGRQMRGLNPEGSGIAFDLFMKTNWLNELYGKGITLASGTPISNSVGELFTISRYLQPSELAKRSIQMFDPWANTFGDIGQVAEYLPEGGGYQMVTKFNRFVNIPELMQMVYSVMDSVSADKAGIKRPAVKGGKPEAVLVPQNELVAAYQEVLKQRALEIRKSPREALPDNMLAVVTDGRKAAMDMRMVDPKEKDDPDTKTNYAVKKIVDIWKREKEKRGTQLVFSDMGVPGKVDRFSVYEDLKKKLIKAGIPAGEIAFVHDANNDRERKAQFAKVNAGKIRVWVASTKKGGTGVNVQERVAAIHNLDVHWNLSNLLQRIGRGQRQGNIYDEIEIFNYATEGTVDAFMWDKVQAKGRFVDQIMSGDVTMREAEDISQETMSAAEMVAVASGDPLIAEKVELEAAVQKLSLQAAAFEDTLASVRQDLARFPLRIKGYKDEIKVRQAAIAEVTGVKRVRIGEREYDLAKEDDAKALANTIEQKAKANSARYEKQYAKWSADYSEHLKDKKHVKDPGDRPDREEPIGAVLGDKVNMPLSVSAEGLSTDLVVIRTQAGDRNWGVDRSFASGLERVNKELDKEIASAESEIAHLEGEIPKLRGELSRKFEKGEELDAKRKRLAEVNRTLTEKEQADTVGEDDTAMRAKFRFRKGNGGVVAISAFTDVKIDALDDLSFFVYELEDRWYFLEAGTGLSIANAGTEEEAIAAGKQRIEDIGADRVRETVERTAKITDEEKENALVDIQDEEPKADVGSDQSLEDRWAAFERGIEVKEQLQALARQLFPQTRLQVVDKITIPPVGRITRTIEARGIFEGQRNLITVALQQRNPIATLRHEGIHALRAMGAFTGQEWAVLERRAVEQWRARYDIDKRYTWLKGDEAGLNEEAIAEAFKSFSDGEAMGGQIGRAFARLKRFFERLANALRGMGFQTADDVFRRIEAGEVGQRQSARAAAAGAKAALPYETAPDSLMGFRRNGPHKAFDETRYPHVQYVRVTWDNRADSIVDAIKGMNRPHAMERARRNWPDASKVEALSREEALREDPSLVTAAEPKADINDLLEQYGVPAGTIMDAERALMAGDRVFVAPEMDEEPYEIKGTEGLRGYTAEQVLVVPQGSGEEGAAEPRFDVADTEKAAEGAADGINNPPANVPESEPSFMGGDRRLVDDLGLFSRIAVHPRTIAAIDRSFTPVYEAAVKQFERRDEIAAELGRIIQPYFDLPEASKKRVNAVLELGRLQGEIYGRGKEPVVAENSVAENAVLTKVGEKVELGDKEKGGYWAARKAMDKALTLFKDQLIVDFGEDPIALNTSALILEEAAISEDRARTAKLELLASIVQEIEQAKRLGYVPFSRWGQVGILVQEPAEDEGAPPNTLHYEMVEVDGLLQRAKRALRLSPRELGKMPEVAERLKALNAKYPDADIRVFQLSDKSPMSQVKLSDLDALAEVARVDNETWDKVRDQLATGMKQRGFRKHFFGSRNVPGYSVDFERALADYVVGIAGYLARRRFSNTWDNAIKYIPGTKPKLRQYAETYRQYVNDPQEELGVLRGAVFIYYIAGVPATAMINMTQVPLITAPYLGQFVSPARVQVQLARAYKDALQMLSIADVKDFAQLKKSLDVFDPKKAPEDLRPAFRKAWDEGFFVPLNVYEMMGLAHNRNAALRGLSQKAKVVAEDIATMFTAAERLNRIVTFIAAYRIGRMAGVEERAKSVLKGNALARRELLAEFSPTVFAEWVIDETHYRMGKVNRPSALRGVGTAVFQFKTFILQTIELYARMAVQNGPRGKIAFGTMMALLLVTSGLWGLPFAEDLADIIESIYKRTKGLDLDIKTKVREVIYELTGSAKVSEVASRGTLRLTGVDVSERIGQGDILPNDIPGALGVPFDLTVQRATTAWEMQSRGQTWLSAGELLPNFLRNPITAIDWAEGVRSKRTGKVVIPPEEITPTDKVLKAVGFTSADIANRREMEYAKTRADRSVDQVRREFYARLSMAEARRIRAEDRKDMAKALELDRDIDKIYGEIEAYNAGQADHEQVRINKKTLRDQVRQEFAGAEAKKGPKQSRARAEQLREIYGR